MKRSHYLRLFVIHTACLFCFLGARAQALFFGEEPITWESNKPPILPASLSNYESADLVILEDNTRFYFYATNNEKIVRRLLIKINNTNGLEAIQKYRLPESFDYARDVCFYKQGRKSRINIPFIQDFT